MTENQNQGKEVWLHPKAFKQMLKGSLAWADVAARLNKPEEVPDTSSPKLGGIKVVFLLGGALLLTMVTWVYFVFYC